MSMTAVNVPTGSVQILWSAIDGMDLGPIKFKLMDNKDGEGWSREKADRVEIGYKRFLFLNKKFPERSIVPTKEIDIFWHYHILDTMKYFQDCDEVFGHYFHHFPYFGMRGEEDAAQLSRAFAETRLLFMEEFGEFPEGSSTDCANACTTPCEGGNDATILAGDCANACTTPCQGGGDPPSVRMKNINHMVRPTIN